MNAPDENADLLAEAIERLETDGPEALESFVARHAADHPQLAARIELLRSIGLLHAQEAAEPEPIPERIGDFELLRPLGSGGMGVVYVARDEALGRDVALKLIRPEQLYFPRARRRFQREIETIARLEHPGVVRVYNCGEAKGIPYFTMELLSGISLEELLVELRAQAGPGLDDRAVRELLVRRCLASGGDPHLIPPASGRGWVQLCLHWMTQICEAVAYAHSRGVLHRDLKPANILLTWSGQPVLVDFGLASAEGAPRLTRSGAHLGSPAYMAPEQVRRGSSESDLRTDLHALGVILYEMLALRHPYHLDSASSEETLRRIQEGAAPPLESLNRAIPPDAATVCMTAMDPTPERRYASAAELGADLRNVLELRPILARRPTLALRTRRWIQRHPAASVALGLGFLLFVVAPSAIAWREYRHGLDLTRAGDEIRRVNRELEARNTELIDANDQVQRAKQAIEQEATVARETLAFVTEDLLQQIQPDEMGREVPLREVLDAAAAGVAARFAELPEVEASIRAILGDSYRSLGELEEAERHLGRAVELHAHRPGEEPRLMAQSRLGSLRRMQGRFDEAHALLREAHTGLCTLFGEGDPRSLGVANNLGLALVRMGRGDEAVELLEATMAHRRRALGERDERSLSTMSNLCLAYSVSSDPARATALSARLVELCNEVLGVHPITLHATNLRAASLGPTQPLEAFRLQREVSRLTDELYGTRHRESLLRLADLAMYSLSVAPAPDQLRLAEAVVERLPHFQPESPEALRAVSSCAEVHLAAGDAGTAIDLVAPAFELALESYDEESNQVKDLAYVYARALSLDGDPEGALELFELSYLEDSSAGAQATWYGSYGRCLEALDRDAEAAAAFREAARLFLALSGPDDARVVGYTRRAEALEAKADDGAPDD